MRYEFLKFGTDHGEEVAYLLDHEEGVVVLAPVERRHIGNGMRKVSYAEDEVVAARSEKRMKRLSTDEVLRPLVSEADSTEDDIEAPQPERVVRKPKPMVPRAFLGVMTPPGESGAAEVRRRV